jgi:quercetin dioxygenase-like cupin family protein
VSHPSYPPPRYHGHGGEVTARFTPAGTGPHLDRPGSRVDYLATGADTDGEYGLYRYEMGPRSPGPATHFHRTISESFYVLDGQVSLYDGDRWTVAGRGDFLYVPAGGLHAFRNDTDEAAAMLLLFAPGAPRETYFEQIGEMFRRGGPQLTEFLRAHDNVFVDDPD